MWRLNSAVGTWTVGSVHWLLNHSHLPSHLKAQFALSTWYASSHLILPNPMMLILVLLQLTMLCTLWGRESLLNCNQLYMLTHISRVDYLKYIYCTQDEGTITGILSI